MSLQKFDVYGWVVGFLSTCLLCILSGTVFVSFECWGLGGPAPEWGGVFRPDLVGFYLSLLTLLLWGSLGFFNGWVSGLSQGYIGLSLFFSLLSYFCVHGLWFWVFYELSILPLLFLLICESPYSERYVASWYLLGYVVLTSLPMLLCIFYISAGQGSFCLGVWDVSGVGSGVFLVLGIMFITKIPLPPFHVWLPIVHAEATSPVSVCLSGYIMKLGILGVIRFCSHLLPECIFSPLYVLGGLVLSVLFFFSAIRELDGKRWLAFLSLSHILVAAVCLCVCGVDGSFMSMVYCLGHGLSAGVVFLFLWVIYEVSGSRNWAILKSGLSGGLFIRCLFASCLCTAASLPPTVQFFCEVFILSEASWVSLFFVFLMCVYLFFGGLVPMFFLGGVLSRHNSVSYGGGFVSGGWSAVFFLVVWSFLLFLLI